jgi:hypothetical protein
MGTLGLMTMRKRESQVQTEDGGNELELLQEDSK